MNNCLQHLKDYTNESIEVEHCLEIQHINKQGEPDPDNLFRSRKGSANRTRERRLNEVADRTERTLHALQKRISGGQSMVRAGSKRGSTTLARIPHNTHKPHKDLR
jgi:hypothetical protein